MDNGDALQSSMMLMIKTDPLTKEQIFNFKSQLMKILLQKNHDFFIEIDYGACKELRDAAKYANFDTDYRFPVKTCMHVKNGSVRVSCGYRSPWETLFPIDKNVRDNNAKIANSET